MGNKKYNITNPYETYLYPKEYYELYAMHLLQELFPDKYANLCFIGGNESPDLQDRVHGIGVEVTCAFDTEELNARQLFAKFAGAKETEIPQSVREIWCNAGVFVNTDGVNSDHVFTDFISAEKRANKQEKLLDQSLHDKTAKLNGPKYDHFERQELFVITHRAVSKTCVEKTIRNFYNACNGSDLRVYDAIYVCALKQLFSVNISVANTQVIQLLDIEGLSGECEYMAYVESGCEAKSKEILQKHGWI